MIAKAPYFLNLDSLGMQMRSSQGDGAARIFQCRKAANMAASIHAKCDQQILLAMAALVFHVIIPSFVASTRAGVGQQFPPFA